MLGVRDPCARPPPLEPPIIASQNPASPLAHACARFCMAALADKTQRAVQIEEYLISALHEVYVSAKIANKFKQASGGFTVAAAIDAVPQVLRAFLGLDSPDVKAEAEASAVSQEAAGNGGSLLDCEGGVDWAQDWRLRRRAWRPQASDDDRREDERAVQDGAGGGAAGPEEATRWATPRTFQRWLRPW